MHACMYVCIYILAYHPYPLALTLTPSPTHLTVDEAAAAQGLGDGQENAKIKVTPNLAPCGFYLMKDVETFHNDNFCVVSSRDSARHRIVQFSVINGKRNRALRRGDVLP